MAKESNEYDDCRAEQWERGWRVVRRDGSVIEPLFDTKAAAERARRDWQALADDRKSK
jgi:hypothetical protein